ncbi:hypothetical protein CHLRE_17g700800v5 [Chlamydomonas reinhardtii]|uniref:Uncharacterized protein n=1 Tax=Chlamydomonas reinhardtii TaxID=3055 RepID=A8IQG1_CHLRE|nr:uncharacterized protein CHLRE_17g700800v5 [Chlamydomonas reinhardtii]PNW69982.1 hypothetical protein CHLRE_17g700800v5 [Chlamydomonas reinhardtii]|eukprot:XP_001691605.1 predicted protein [Chlamydomonas reinhardtii]
MQRPQSFMDRLSNVEAQLAELQQELQQDPGTSLLREIASQTEHKLARCVMPGLKPQDLVHVTFSRLASGRDQGVDRAAFHRVVHRHPGLAGGLESLKELATCVRRPLAARTKPGGGQQAVTSELLRELIDKEYPDGDPVKPDVEAVLACLQELAEHLGERIFIT